MMVANPKSGLPSTIFFYCKDCEKVAVVTRAGSRYVYTCNTCGTKNVAFGTQRSLMSFFRLEEKDFEEPPEPPKNDSASE